jgi:hypothetical protein
MAAEGARVTPNVPLPPGSPVPPLWARSLLSSLLPRMTEESVSGDLLEQYRETVFPGRGQSSANAWYLRQVASFLWRATWMFVAFTAAALILRTLADTFAPPGLAPHGYQLRSSLSTYAAVGTFLFAGLYAGYRTGQSRAGMLTAFVASAVGHAIGLTFDIVLFYAVIQHDPDKLNLFYATGGWGEELAFPVIIPIIATMLGLLGGTCGKYLSRVPGQRLVA